MYNTNQADGGGTYLGYCLGGGVRLHQEVSEIKDAIHEIINEATLSAKLGLLLTTVDRLTQEAQTWPGGNNRVYMPSIMALHSQVAVIQAEWDSMFSTLTILREKLEALEQLVTQFMESPPSEPRKGMINS